MKTKLVTLVVCLAAWLSVADEPYYTRHTNVFGTNFIAGTSTNLYTGTNYWDATRFRKAEFTATFSGESTESNWMFFDYVGGPDTTNWDYSTVYSVPVQAQGTNRAFGQAKFDLETIGYVKLWQTRNTNAMNLTNVAAPIYTKTVPRN